MKDELFTTDRQAVGKVNPGIVTHGIRLQVRVGFEYSALTLKCKGLCDVPLINSRKMPPARRPRKGANSSLVELAPLLEQLSNPQRGDHSPRATRSAIWRVDRAERLVFSFLSISGPRVTYAN